MLSINDVITKNSLGPAYVNSFYFLPAYGTKGGILLAANSSALSLGNPWQSTHIISATVTDLRINLSWSVTRVYGPQGDFR
jgi:hypothetical protein